MALDWNWGELLSGIVGIIIGWLARVFSPGGVRPGKDGPG